MLNSRILRLTPRLPLAGMLICAALNFAEAATNPMNLTDVKKIVDGLGYDSTMDKTYLTIKTTGKYDLDLSFYFSNDGSSLFVSTNLGDVPADKMAAMPTTKLLEFNNTHSDIFSLGDGNDGAKSIAMTESVSTPAVNAKTLRSAIDNIISNVGDNDTLWKPDLWSAAASSGETGGKGQKNEGAKAPTLDLARSDLETLWEKAPLTVRKVLFIAKDPESYGVYEPRPSSEFKEKDALISYFEPQGYTWKSKDDGTFDYGVTFDFEIKNKDGVTLFEKKKFDSSTRNARAKKQEALFYSTLTLSGLKPDTYTLIYTLHDLFSDKSTTTTQPFTIKSGS